MTSDYEKEQGALEIIQGLIDTDLITKDQVVELTDADADHLPETAGPMDVLLYMDSYGKLFVKLQPDLLAKAQGLFTRGET